MTKDELVTKIAEDAGITKKEAGEALNAFTGSVSGALAKGESVCLGGLGTFSVWGLMGKGYVESAATEDSTIWEEFEYSQYGNEINTRMVNHVKIEIRTWYLFWVIPIYRSESVLSL